MGYWGGLLGQGLGNWAQNKWNLGRYGIDAAQLGHRLGTKYLPFKKGGKVGKRRGKK